MNLRTCLYLLISLSLSFGLLSGCAEINKIIDDVNQNVKPEEDRPSASSPAAPENPPRASSTTPESPPRATSPVRVSLDGHGDEASDNYGIYWETANSVSATPKMVFRLDPSMGDFHSCILNIYEAKPDGTEKKMSPWAFVEQDGEPASKAMSPNSPFSLTKPGGNVTIISPQGKPVDAMLLETGKTYIMLVVISGSNNNHTHKVRFTVK